MSEDRPRGQGRHEVPIGVEIAAAWSWRLIVIAVAAYGGIWLLGHFSEVTIPIAIAVLLTALTIPVVDALSRRLPRLASTFVVVLGLLVIIAGLVALVGTSLSTQFSDVRSKVVDGIDQLQHWAQTGPLHLSDKQLRDYVDQITDAVKGHNSQLLGQAAEVGSTVTHFVAGFFIVLFATFFFLYDGARIWRWTLQLFPRASQAKVDSSARAAWSSLTSFVRATVVVALTDGAGIMLIAFILQVPLAFAIGVIVFIGAFVPIIGALVSGMVAVLIALVAHGPVTALLMLGGVVLVQQFEAHVLQPFLMGHLVAIHPLAIILVIAIGVIAGGVVGALLAVPFAASLNSVVRDLAADRPVRADGAVGDDQEGEPA